jgi:hypothetical protein
MRVRSAGRSATAGPRTCSAATLRRCRSGAADRGADDSPQWGGSATTATGRTPTIRGIMQRIPCSSAGRTDSGYGWCRACPGCGSGDGGACGALTAATATQALRGVGPPWLVLAVEPVEKAGAPVHVGTNAGFPELGRPQGGLEPDQLTSELFHTPAVSSHVAQATPRGGGQIVRKQVGPTVTSYTVLGMATTQRLATASPHEATVLS